MGMRLPGEPEDYMSRRVARAFRKACARVGVPPVMYLGNGRYTGDEHGMTIGPEGVALYVVAGLRALCGSPLAPQDEGLPRDDAPYNPQKFA